MVVGERMKFFNASHKAAESKRLLVIGNGGERLNKCHSFVAISGFIFLIIEPQISICGFVFLGRDLWFCISVFLI